MASPTPKLLAVLLAPLALAACGGGGGDSGSIAPPPPEPPPDDGGGDTGGIDRSGLRVLGSISGFGSVIVDGVRFDTSGATIEVDDSPGSEDDLKTGEVVFVSGEIDDDGNATAATVVTDDLLRGPVESIDLATETFIVLGQTVKVRVDTAFEDAVSSNALEGLSTGNPVEVDGFLSPDDRIIATRVSLDDGDDLQVVGFISSLDEGASTFSIGSLVIDYANASFDDFDGTGLAEGRIVEVEGDALGSSGELIATEVELERGDLGADDDDRAEIEGVITAVNSSTAFEVNGIAITTDGATTYEDGTAADIVAGAGVEVSAVAQADGTLLASRVEFEGEKIVEIEATVEAVDAAVGSVQLVGVTVFVEDGTRFEDDSDLDLRRFTLADINVGDYLEIGGSESGAADDEVTAALVKRDDDGGTEVEVQARVQSVNQPDFVVLGITVRTNAATEFEGDDDDDALTPAEFFAAAEGRIVEIEGTWDGSVLTAEEVEFELED